MNWLCPDPLQQSDNVLDCRFRFQHTKPLVKCTVLRKSDENSNELIVLLDKPLRAVTPGQYAVFYNDKACLGSARISMATRRSTKQLISSIMENS